MRPGQFRIPLKCTLFSSVAFFASQATASATEVAPQDQTEVAPEVPTAGASPAESLNAAPHVIPLKESKLEEHSVNFYGKSATLIVRKLTFANGMEMSRLGALHTTDFEMIFFHQFEPGPTKVKFDTKSGVNGTLIYEGSQVSIPQESFDVQKNLKIRSVKSALQNENKIAEANPFESTPNFTRRFSELNPCSKSEIPGLLRLRLPEIQLIHSDFSLKHETPIPFFRSNVWVCATLEAD